MSQQQTQQQKRRAGAATRAAAARWAAEMESEDLENCKSASPQDKDSLSWWAASVSEVQALERLIERKINKVSQLTEESAADPVGTANTATLQSDAKSNTILALNSAGMNLPAGGTADDVGALREEFARLATQVKMQEGRFGSWFQTMEADLADVRKMFGSFREEMKGLIRDQPLEMRDTGKAETAAAEVGLQAAVDAAREISTAVARSTVQEAAATILDSARAEVRVVVEEGIQDGRLSQGGSARGCGGGCQIRSF
jgi:hypothetical protein